MIIQRAIAKTLVFDTADVINLLRKYGDNVQNNITYKELYAKWRELVMMEDFDKDFLKLMIKRGRIADYNNHRNIIGAIIGGVLAFGSTIAGGLFKSKQNDQAAKMTSEQMQAQNDIAIMQMMMQEEANKVTMTKQENMLVMGTVGAMVVITGLIILSRSKR